jgi:hypothetical protein
VERKPFLLRLDPATMAALRAWAGDDLRSLNGQIEFLLRRALREAGRLPRAAGREPPASASEQSGEGAEQRTGIEVAAKRPSKPSADRSR